MGSLRVVAALVALAALAGCGSLNLSTATTEPSTAAPTGPDGRAANVTGRWVLTSSNGGSCTMTFGAASGALEGTIAPEGGCPGDFFTSRKWTIEQNSLVIRDHTGKPLAQLAAAGPNRYEGQAIGGIAISLAR
jgi:hypothetical protein